MSGFPPKRPSKAAKKAAKAVTHVISSNAMEQMRDTVVEQVVAQLNRESLKTPFIGAFDSACGALAPGHPLYSAAHALRKRAIRYAMEALQDGRIN